MHALLIALLAGAAMFVQDLLSAPLSQAEARNRAHLAGLLDTVGWIVAITTTFISVDVLQGHSLSAKIMVVVLVSGANYFGTLLGTKLGKRYVRDDTVHLAERVSALERDKADRTESQ